MQKMNKKILFSKDISMTTKFTLPMRKTRLDNLILSYEDPNSLMEIGRDIITAAIHVIIHVIQYGNNTRHGDTSFKYKLHFCPKLCKLIQFYERLESWWLPNIDQIVDNTI